MHGPWRSIPGWVPALCLVVVVVIGALVAESYAVNDSKTLDSTGVVDDTPHGAKAYFCTVYHRVVKSDPDATPERLAALVAAGKRDAASDPSVAFYDLVRTKSPAELSSTIGPFVESLRASA